MYPQARSEQPTDGRPVPGLDGSRTPEKTKASGPRALVVEPHPAMRVALEYLLSREGYRVESSAEAPENTSGPALVFLSGSDGHGLHVFEADGAADVSSATGILAFVPKPFGAADVLRVARAVSGFDGRKKRAGVVGGEAMDGGDERRGGRR